MKATKWVGLAVLLAAPLSAADKGSWTGYLTDPHCGKKAASPAHTADCIESCTRDGSKAQIWNESDDKAYNLDDFSKVKSLVGSKVTVTGTLDPKTSTIRIESVTRAETQ
jgi:hypothetical protein